MQLSPYAARQCPDLVHTATQPSPRHVVEASDCQPPRRDLGQRRLELHYQPIVDLESFAIRGFEALVRLRDSHDGLLHPDAFLHHAQAAGIMAAIDRWVLTEACRRAASWRRTYPRHRSLTVSVNLGAERLETAGLGADVHAVLESTGLEPSALKLEITEHGRRSCSEVTSEVVRELRTAGIGFHLDDFGTGYASLSCLRTFPCEALKIDRSFVLGADRDPVCRELVRSCAALARNLGVTAIAEGVETPAQLAAIHDLGCELAQGYFFSRPLDREEMQALLARSPVR